MLKLGKEKIDCTFDSKVWCKSFIFKLRTQKIVNAKIFMTLGCVFRSYLTNLPVLGARSGTGSPTGGGSGGSGCGKIGGSGDSGSWGCSGDRWGWGIGSLMVPLCQLLSQLFFILELLFLVCPLKWFLGKEFWSSDVRERDAKEATLDIRKISVWMGSEEKHDAKEATLYIRKISEWMRSEENTMPKKQPKNAFVFKAGHIPLHHGNLEALEDFQHQYQFPMTSLPEVLLIHWLVTILHS